MAKKKTTKKKAASTAAKAPTKSQVMSLISEETGLSKKDVAAVFDSLQGLIGKNLGKRGPGYFTVPGLMKIKRRDIPRRPARKNVYVPLLKEYRDIPAKPARKAVKVTPLKGLKDMV